MPPDPVEPRPARADDVTLKPRRERSGTRDRRVLKRVTILVDDADPDGARAIEVQGEVELYPTGGERINPRFPNFVPEFMRIHPRRIVSWGWNSPASNRSLALSGRNPVRRRDHHTKSLPDLGTFLTGP